MFVKKPNVQMIIIVKDLVKNIYVIQVIVKMPLVKEAMAFVNQPLDQIGYAYQILVKMQIVQPLQTVHQSLAQIGLVLTEDVKQRYVLPEMTV